MRLHQAEKFLHSNRNKEQNEKLTCQWKIITNYISVNVLIFKMYKEHIQLNCKKHTKTQANNG